MKTRKSLERRGVVNRGRSVKLFNSEDFRSRHGPSATLLGRSLIDKAGRVIVRFGPRPWGKDKIVKVIIPKDQLFSMSDREDFTKFFSKFGWRFEYREQKGEKFFLLNLMT